MPRLAFIIPGAPVAWQRAGDMAKVVNGKPIVLHFTQKKTDTYESHVATIAKLATNRARWVPAKGARYALELRIFRTYEGKGGDLDNYVKALLDGMNAVLYVDDSQLRDLHVSLRQDRERPRVEVVISTMDVEALRA